MNFRVSPYLLLFTLLSFSKVAFGWKLEADKMVVSNTAGNVSTHINFRQTYSAPPLVFTLPTNTGGQPAALRVTNVSTTGFDVYSVEEDGSDGPHAQMSAVPYFAIEAGSHVFPDGTKIVAGSISTQRFQSRLIAGASWDSISLSGFSSTPIVLGQIQTRVNERTDLVVPSAVSQPWMTTAVSNVTSSGFDIALERSETLTGTLSSNETIAYLAIDSGLSGGNHYFASNNANQIEYESIRSNDVIQGWDDSATGYSVPFSKSYSDPIVVANKNTRDGSDGGWFRRVNIASNSIDLVVDEDTSNDSDRSHTTERGGLLVFSEPFDTEFINSGQAEVIINEVMYNESVTGVNNDEFVELYVTVAGNIKGLIISDQDNHFYSFPSQSVAVGDYVIYHTGTGTNSSAAGVHHYYQGISNIWNNGSDDILLLKPSNDVTATADGKYFNAIPIDYMAYGRNSVGSSVDAIPTSMLGASVTWTYSFGSELKNAIDGESISLTPNANDSDKAACWERTTSDNASDNGCTGYLSTKDTNATSFINSEAENNNAAPVITLTKSVETKYDPYNGASNPKAIPGSVLEYIIFASNSGTLAADNNSITVSDFIPANTRLCVANSGNCLAPYFVDGSPSSNLTLASTQYFDSGGAAYSASASADGTDSNVKKLSASMNGAFLPQTGATAPNFELKFRVIVE